MSKELAGQLFARVDINFNDYKRLKEEYEITLLKVYNPEHRKLYKQSKAWIKNNEILKDVISNKKDIESDIRTKNEINGGTIK